MKETGEQQKQLMFIIKCKSLTVTDVLLSICFYSQDHYGLELQTYIISVFSQSLSWVLICQVFPLVSSFIKTVKDL